ncbi:uncharacterized protein A1O5_11235 [Cladophialophora psammophila CBS 110553]|uniref:Uncharacterized protein n=1 Tax=Cladophialophora psammophila CBS 110553 TaxID=1182543 RepID=W9WCL4_9EURO|nr:uncharacterized protein A1O5_11235 [Cladophialophora psammophila CBS 110553]EXJ65708.1 hypothetical protein A1O5_11235 [Cladophialophora psammophila CBS 110553]
MNFLFQDARTQTAFESKFAGSTVLIITFFCWEVGVDLQKNQLGLLRTLIWQLLESMDLAPSVQIWSNVLKKVSPPLPIVWTQKQLGHVLKSLVQATSFKGLEDQFDVIADTNKIFQDRQKTKICISTRPSASLDSLYKSCPKLRLQDLTEFDIKLYVEDKLVKNLATEDSQRLATLASEEMSELVEMVVDKAEGVFLWVSLAIESLLRGIRKDDDWETLCRRVEQLPEGIFNLYEHMWKRMALDQPLKQRKLLPIYNISGFLAVVP